MPLKKGKSQKIYKNNTGKSNMKGKGGKKGGKKGGCGK